MSISTMIRSLCTLITSRFWRLFRQRTGRVTFVHTLVILSFLAPNMLLIVETVKAYSPPGPARRTASVESGDEKTDRRIATQHTAQGPVLTADDQPIGSADWAAEIQAGLSRPAVAFVGESFVLDEQGGTLTGLDGYVEITVPNDVLSTGTTFEIGSARVTDGPSHYLSDQPFRIVAHDGLSRGVSTFSEPIAISVNYDPEIMVSEPAALTLFYFDEVSQNWIPLPTAVDTQTHTLTGWVDHLTDFDIDVMSWEAAQLPGLDAYQVAPFTGAATYEYPIWTPPGPGGLNAQVGLSYSSQVVDGATMETQAAWTGMGWALNAGGQIQRSMNGTNHDDSDDTFNLVVAGVRSPLLPVEDARASVNGAVAFRTTDENFWRVWAYLPDAGSDTQYESWIVWDKTGNVYRFGTDDGSRLEYPYCDAAMLDYDGQRNWRWSLKTQTNIHGQSLTFNYFEAADTRIINDPDCSISGEPVEHGNYLDTIEYPNGKYRIRFNREARYDYKYSWTTANALVLHSTKRLDQIRVQHHTGSTWENIHVYDLVYASQADDAIFPGLVWNYDNAGGAGFTTTLVGIRHLNGSQTNELPQTTFIYGDHMHLTQASNGYGGAVAFDYELWHDVEGFKLTGTVQDIDGDECDGGGSDNLPGWSPVNPNVTSVACDGDHIAFIRVGAGNVEAMTLLSRRKARPGSMYLLHTNTAQANGSIQYGLAAGNGNPIAYGAVHPLNNVGVANVADTMLLPADAAQLEVRVVCSPGASSGSKCELQDEFRATPMPSYYRVTVYEIFDGLGGSDRFVYSYDEAATNDGSHSDYVAQNLAKDINGKPRTQFRGHAWSRMTGPDGRMQLTWFHQDDLLSGRAYMELSADASFLNRFESGSAWSSYQSEWDESSGSDQPALVRIHGDQAVRLKDTNGNWTGVMRESDQDALSDGDFALFRFRYTAGAVVQAGLDSTGAAFKAVHARFGTLGDGLDCAQQDSAVLQVNAGATTVNCSETLDLTANAWHTMMMLIDDDQLRFLVWADGQSQFMEFVCSESACPMDDFSGEDWRFVFYVHNTGAGSESAWLDEYTEGRLHSLSASSFDSETIADGANGIDCQQIGADNCDKVDSQSVVWTYLSGSLSHIFDGGSESVASEVAYLYSEADQGGSQFGNQTQTIQRIPDGSGGMFDYRTVLMRFWPASQNAATYLVGLPAFRNTYACAGLDCTKLTNLGTVNLLASTIYLYDEKSTYNQAPSAGKLTTVLTLLDKNQFTYAAAESAYDSWGNVVRSTTFSGEAGYPYTSVPGGSQINEMCYGAGESPCLASEDNGYYSYPLWTENALGHRASFSYSDAGGPTGFLLGVPLSITDPNGQITMAGYDSFGRMISVCMPGDTCTSQATVELSYQDDPTTFTVPFYTEATQKLDAADSLTVRKIYDGRGRLVQSQIVGAVLAGGARDILVDYVYDAFNRPIQQTVPYDVADGLPFGQDLSQPSSSTIFDTRDRPVQSFGPDGTGVTYAYGLAGGALQTAVTDPLGNITTTVLDSLGRVAEVHAAQDPWTAYSYDALDRLVQVELMAAVGVQGTTILVYDEASRKQSMNDMDMGVWGYDYNALGALVSQTDARGCTISFAYDVLNRLTGKTYAGGPPECGGTPVVSYHYDDYTAAFFSGFSPPAGTFNGYRTGMEDGTGHAIWTYSARGQLLSETKTLFGYSAPFVTGFSYNAGGMPVSMTYPDGELVSFEYHAQGAIDRVTSSEHLVPYVDGSDYDAAGRMTRQELGGQAMALQYNYYDWTTPNGQGRLKEILAGTAASVPATASLVDLTYTYDAAGNVNTILDLNNSGQQQCFNYDSLNRLTTASTHNDPGQGCTTQLGGGNYDESYSYDLDNGNLKSKTGQGDYTYDAPVDCVAGSRTIPHAVSAAGAGSFIYDCNGSQIQRVTSAGTFDLTYDAENRVIAVSGPNGTASFEFDGDGRRVLKTAPDGVQTFFVGGHFEVQVDPNGTPPPPTATPEPTQTPAPTATPDPSVGAYCAVGLPQAIPDNSTAGLTTAIVISDTGSLTDLDVEIASDHAAVGQLAITLKHVETGSIITLIHQPGRPASQQGCTEDGIDMILDDSAASAAEHACESNAPALGGSLSPNDSLTSFDNEDLSGTWELKVSDRRNGGTGDLTAFCLHPTVNGNSALGLVRPLGMIDALARPLAVRLSANLSFWIRTALDAAGQAHFSQTLTTPPAGERWTSYYHAGVRRVALRVQDGDTASEAVSFLFGDHLGSTSVVADGTGSLIAEMGYLPWGELRFESGASPTDYGYTDQYNETDDTGLLFYNARWYDPALGRFAQADTVVPGASDADASTMSGVADAMFTPLTVGYQENAILEKANRDARVIQDEGGMLFQDDAAHFILGVHNPKASEKNIDRFSYVENNPLRFTDPTGHKVGGNVDFGYDDNGSVVILWYFGYRVVFDLRDPEISVPTLNMIGNFKTAADAYVAALNEVRDSQVRTFWGIVGMASSVGTILVGIATAPAGVGIAGIGFGLVGFGATSALTIHEHNEMLEAQKKIDMSKRDGWEAFLQLLTLPNLGGRNDDLTVKP